jgi:hypothetical protein
MAKFGTIHNWLDYDSIRMAGVTKEMANIVGKSIGAASVLGGEVVDQAFRNYETKEKGSSFGDDETTLQNEDEQQKDYVSNTGDTGSSVEENVHDGDPHFNPTDTTEEVSNKVSFDNKTTSQNQDEEVVEEEVVEEEVVEEGRSIWDKVYDSLNAGNAYPTVDGKYTPAKGWLGSLGFTNKTVQHNAKLGTVGRIADQFKTYGDHKDQLKFLGSLPKSELEYFAKILKISPNKITKMIARQEEMEEQGIARKLAPPVGFKDLAKQISNLDPTMRVLGSNPNPPTNRLNLADSPSKTPFPRLSPLGRYKETPLNQMQDMLEYGTISEASMPDYLGSIGKAAEQGYNRAIQKFNYNLKVQKERLKGINEQYSSLKVDPTGLSSLDANLKILGKSMQGAYMELMSKKNSMNPFDFMQEKQKLLEQPVIINQAIKTLQQRVKDFNDNRYEVGQATDSRTIDILDTLSKGGGDLKPIYKDGVPYLVGTTLGGENVDVAISEIANGNNDFKFIKSETVQPFINDIIKDYTATEKYYTEGGGIMERKKLRPGWEQVATSKFKEALKMKGEPGMRAYAALFGTNFDGYNKMLEQGEDIEGFLVDSFLNRVNQEFQPYAQAVQTGQLRPTTTSNTQSERERAKFVKDWNAMPPPDKNNIGSYTGLLRHPYGIRKTESGDFGIVNIDKPGDGLKKIDFSKPPQEIKQQLLDFAKYRVHQSGQQQDLSGYNFDL